MNEWTLALSAAAFVLALLSLILLLRLIKRQPDYERLLRESWNANLPALKTELTGELRASRGELTGTVQTTMKTFADSLVLAQTQTAERQDVRLRELIESLEKNQLQLKSTIAETNRILAEAQEKQFAMQDKRMQGIEAQFTAFTAAVQSRLETLQKDNSEQLEKMRVTVDEKLQKTLDERISQSFRLVNERLQEVYTGLGEMKTLANGVGDLKKVLSNVKTRGIVGEYQLGALIDDILTRDQFEENVITKKGSTTRVEYAIKMPGEDGSFVYLPVDSKFPGDVYAQLVDAYDAGDPAAIAAAQAMLTTRIKGCAKDIRDKYIDPPNTTDFGIMFLPFEGLMDLFGDYPVVVGCGHPFRAGGHVPELPEEQLRRLQFLDLNGKDLALDRERTERLTYALGRELDIPVVSGSDTHQAVQYGCVTTVFEREVDTVPALYGEMTAGRYAIDLSDTAAFQVRTACLLKRSLKEIHALGGDYVAILTREATA